MSQDVLADALNAMRNAKVARKENVEIGRVSKLLIEVLKIMKQKGAVKKYKIDAKDKFVEITLGDFFECKSIKPRFSVKTGQIERYRRRYLPAKNVGTIIVSTPKGLMTHEETVEKGLGGSLIAYFY
jgi:small subunit ribosomal protein S8